MKPTQEQVIQMAREAGLMIHTGDEHFFSDILTRFSTLVRNQTLEDAATKLESMWGDGGDVDYFAEVIRNMKEPTP